MRLAPVKKGGADGGYVASTEKEELDGRSIAIIEEEEAEFGCIATMEEDEANSSFAIDDSMAELDEFDSYS